MTRTKKLDRNQLYALLSELSQRLEQRGETAQFLVVGGAAIALAYNGRRTTSDIDAAFTAADTVCKIAADMSEEHRCQYLNTSL